MVAKLCKLYFVRLQYQEAQRSCISCTAEKRCLPDGVGSTLPEVVYQRITLLYLWAMKLSKSGGVRHSLRGHIRTHARDLVQGRGVMSTTEMGLRVNKRPSDCSVLVAYALSPGVIFIDVFGSDLTAAVISLSEVDAAGEW